MQPKLIHLAAAVVVAATVVSAALSRDEMPQCIAQVAARLRDVPIEPTIESTLDRAFPADEAEPDYDKWVDMRELTGLDCLAHMDRLGAALGDLDCHRAFVESAELEDEYSRAILRTADRHTRLFVLGAAMCTIFEDDQVRGLADPGPMGPAVERLLQAML